MSAAPRSGGCGEPFELAGEVVRVDLLHVDVEHAEGAGAELEGEETQIELDARTRIEGFDRHGIPYLEPGDRVRLQVRFCRLAEVDWPVADLVEPAA